MLIMRLRGSVGVQSVLNKMVQSENTFLHMKSFCCFLNHSFCFCKSRVVPRFMRGLYNACSMIVFVSLFVFLFIYFYLFISTHGLEALSAMLIFKGVQYTIKNI